MRQREGTVDPNSFFPLEIGLEGSGVLAEAKGKDWEVYIIRARSGKLYTGITTDLDRRLEEHAGKRRGARFFHMSEPEAVVFRERHENRSRATRREIAIKKMTREQKLRLIARGSSF